MTACAARWRPRRRRRNDRVRRTLRSRSEWAANDHERCSGPDRARERAHGPMSRMRLGTVRGRHERHRHELSLRDVLALLGRVVRPGEPGGPAELPHLSRGGPLPRNTRGRRGRRLGRRLVPEVRPVPRPHGSLGLTDPPGLTRPRSHTRVPPTLQAGRAPADHDHMVSIRERIHGRPLRYVTVVVAGAAAVEAFGVLVYSVLLPLTG